MKKKKKKIRNKIQCPLSMNIQRKIFKQLGRNLGTYDVEC